MGLDKRKQYDSQVTVFGKRIGIMEDIARARFQDSFISIQIKMPIREFIILLDDTADMNDVEWFEDKYPGCRIDVYKKIRSKKKDR